MRRQRLLAARALDEQTLTQADLNALTDARLGVIKAALQMTPDQAKYWPAIEEAVRARAAGRLQRLKALAALRDKGGDADPVALMQERASNLIQRGTDLKKVADAWEPLYKTLNDEQKQRMRLFAADFLKLVINAGTQSGVCRSKRKSRSKSPRLVSTSGSFRNGSCAAWGASTAFPVGHGIEMMEARLAAGSCRKAAPAAALIPLRADHPG